MLAESAGEGERSSEHDLVRKLEKLNAATYDDPVVLAEARLEANWYVTQLKVAGKAVPDLTRLGL